MWTLRCAALALLAVSCGDDGPPRPASGGGAPALLDAPAAEASAPAPAAPEIPADAPVVVFLGDSIGAGLHLAEHQAFPVLLRDRLAEEGRPFQLVNSCESGRTTSGGVTALEWVLRREPALVVLELGGNDGLRGIALEEVERNLRAMIERAREAGAEVLLLGVRLPPNYGDYGARFDALYPTLAEEYGTAFVPFYMQGVGGVPEMNLPDGLHPTAEGQQRLADNVIEALRAALR
jgi:acyl-CoA thioesterase-1